MKKDAQTSLKVSLSYEEQIEESKEDFQAVRKEWDSGCSLGTLVEVPICDANNSSTLHSAT